MKKLFNRPVRIPAKQRIVTKTLFHFFAVGYLVWLFYAGINDQLGGDPVEALLNATGIMAINLLLFTLALSPLAQRLPCGDLITYRRMSGIYVFVYALMHFLTYIGFELGFDFSLIGSELLKRPYIMVGFTALIILLLLTITSVNKVRRKMGRKWQTLHNFVYLALGLAILHYTWALKTGWQSPVFYWIGAILLVLSRQRILRLLKINS
ncbi:protein-methionine-sulfoxide reductase heme-binding subunit MsrQ [Alteromonas sp. 14N.309.X.WAT.G.H12]|uniref:protein-methionine-sulfoxide reductase heme-binding subunit MsrQ n=1 Tax=Alteromonas sp. 14N.309.X.WAT.G.H12 TaxID=3120824 RepID=UPI002FD0A462